MTKHATVLILDYGSQYTQLIARRVREAGIYSRILPGGAPLERIREVSPRAVILSGGPASVFDADAPGLAEGFLDYQAQAGFAVLGICYGMQLLAHGLGGGVSPARVREYGRMEVRPDADAASATRLFAFKNGQAPFKAWMSHGDEIARMPEGFRLVARSASGTPAAMENPARALYALQFHPEVTHTENGRDILNQFLLKIAGIRPDWNMGSVMDEQIEIIRKRVGPKAHAICALSGGVDSAVAAELVHRALGDRLHCVFVDHGLLRFRERERVTKLFEERLKLPVTCVDASARFLGELAGVADPEKKRKIIGREFIAVFEESKARIAERIGHTAEYLVQGTLYPDVIESSPPPGAASGSGVRGHSATIKSHHNVGGLPEDLKFQLIEPLRDLFKDEVRELGRVMGVPEDFLKRHPFPGPGLAVRVLGAIDPKDLETLRLADEIFIEEIRAHGLYDRIWQAFAVFLPVKSVGVQGDGRTHDNVVALRAVTSSDGMTADWFPFDHAFLARVSNRICNEVRGVNRVVYDVSSKPPATIEWE